MQEKRERFCGKSSPLKIKLRDREGMWAPVANLATKRYLFLDRRVPPLLRKLNFCKVCPRSLIVRTNWFPPFSIVLSLLGVTRARLEASGFFVGFLSDNKDIDSSLLPRRYSSAQAHFVFEVCNSLLSLPKLGECD